MKLDLSLPHVVDVGGSGGLTSHCDDDAVRTVINDGNNRAGSKRRYMTVAPNISSDVYESARRLPWARKALVPSFSSGFSSSRAEAWVRMACPFLVFGWGHTDTGGSNGARRQ